MLDIETASTSPCACILTIGAVKFTRDGTTDSNVFYERVEMNSCLRLGCDMSVETMKWWNSQSKEARYEALENPDRKDIKKVLVKLATWMKGVKYVWANSPSFDCVILKSCFDKCNVTCPWKFWNERDCRTLFDLCDLDVRNYPQAGHNALDDCQRQIKMLHSCFETN